MRTILATAVGTLMIATSPIDVQTWLREHGVLLVLALLTLLVTLYAVVGPLRAATYKRLRIAFTALFIAWVPGMAAVAWLSERLFNSSTPFFVLGFVWMASLGATGLIISSSKCAHCGVLSPYWPFLSSRCRRCGRPPLP